jgi:hypothetical protein
MMYNVQEYHQEFCTISVDICKEMLVNLPLRPENEENFLIKYIHCWNK